MSIDSGKGNILLVRFDLYQSNVILYIPYLRRTKISTRSTSLPILAYKFHYFVFHIHQSEIPISL